MTEEQVQESRHPQLRIGSLDIPAVIVPIVSSALFGVFKIWQRKLPPWIPRTPPHSPEKSEKNAAADVENLEQPPSKEKQTALETLALWIGGAGFFVLYAAILTGPIFARAPKSPRVVLLAVPVGSVLATLAVYANCEKKNARLQAGAIAAAATGILIQQELLGYLPPWKWTFTIPVSMLALLSWWPDAQESCHSVYRLISAMLLMLIIQTHLPEHFWYDEAGKFGPVSRPALTIMLLPLPISIFWARACMWLGLSPTEKAEVKVHSTKEVGRDVLDGVGRILGSGLNLASLFLIMAVSSFATSCFAFNRMILGGPVTPPRFQFNIAGSITGIVVLVLLWQRPLEEDPRRLFFHAADSVGWPVVISTALGLVLMAIEQIRL